MVQFINKLTGGPMWVHESRVEEYKAAGHKLAATPELEEKPAEEPKKTTRRKRD